MKVVVDMPRVGRYGSTHVTTKLYFNRELTRSPGGRHDRDGIPGARRPARSSASPIASSTTGPAPGSSCRRSSRPRDPGTQRLYSFNDLLQLKVIKELTDAGASLQKVRQAIDYVRDQLEDDWSKVTIVTDGDRRLRVHLGRGGRRPSALGPGSARVRVVSVEKVKEQLDGTLRELRPPQSDHVDYGSPEQRNSCEAKEG